jgi:septum formation protein
VPFRAVAPRIDEDDWKRGEANPQELAEALARAKGESLRESEPGSTLIGSDQLVSFNGRVFGKPGDTSGAIDQLAAMSGQAHSLITAVVVWHEGRAYAHTNLTTMSMRVLEREEIERYVVADRPFDCAGSYKVEERGITLFERIETDDHTAIMGLPLIALTSILRRLGFLIP